MTRAAIFIGVDQTGNLPVLKDAAASARRLAEEWARKQDMIVPPPITDETGTPVTSARIKNAVNAILTPANVEQLFIFFAGHGVNVRMGEYWLLTNAPRDAQEAVNVRGSEDLARYCGVPHVVFISDACRTAADTIQAQNVTGSEIFPNDSLTGTQQPVDLFYACALGRPAHEIRDVQTTASEFKGIYTQELLDALRFRHDHLAEWSGTGESRVGYIRPRPLRDHLSRAVARRIRDLDMQTKVIQVPDAHITSDPTAWVSRLSGAAPAAEPMTRSGGRRSSDVAMAQRDFAATVKNLQPPRVAEAPSARMLSKSLVEMAINDPGMVGAALATPPAFGPLHYETQCGFKIRGARFAAAFAVGAALEQLGPSREVVRVSGAARPGASVLLILDDGSGIVLPAIPEFIAALTMEDGELVEVSYEPSDNTWRWNDFMSHAKELRTLRKVVSSATRTGAFRLEGDDALRLARRLQYSKGVDPSLAVYAAYAYNDLHRQDLVRDMNDYMTGDLGAPLFDIAMFARILDGKTLPQRPPVMGFAPLLAQGWAYLRARSIALPGGLDDLPRTLVGSVWTMFNPEGVKRLRATVFQGAQPWRVV